MFRPLNPKCPELLKALKLSSEDHVLKVLLVSLIFLLNSVCTLSLQAVLLPTDHRLLDFVSHRWSTLLWTLGIFLWFLDHLWRSGSQSSTWWDILGRACVHRQDWSLIALSLLWWGALSSTMACGENMQLWYEQWPEHCQYWKLHWTKNPVLCICWSTVLATHRVLMVRLCR